MGKCLHHRLNLNKASEFLLEYKGTQLIAQLKDAHKNKSFLDEEKNKKISTSIVL